MKQIRCVQEQGAHLPVLQHDVLAAATTLFSAGAAQLQVGRVQLPIAELQRAERAMHQSQLAILELVLHERQGSSQLLTARAVLLHRRVCESSKVRLLQAYHVCGDHLKALSVSVEQNSPERVASPRALTAQLWAWPVDSEGIGTCSACNGISADHS